jgi:hypothetical protein
MRQIVLIPITMLIASSSFASTITTTDSFTGSALIYNPATDYSPATGYSPPGNLGGYDGLLKLNGFNTALGTLNKVSLTDSVETSLQFQKAVQIYTSDNYIEIHAHPYIIGQTPYGSSGFGIPYTFSIASTVYGQTYDTGVQYKNAGPSTYTNNLSTTFGPFLNTDIFVPVLGYIVFDSSHGSYLDDATSNYKYSLTITYDYTPISSVPEPGTLGLLLAGLGVVSLKCRRRRSQTSDLIANQDQLHFIPNSH